MNAATVWLVARRELGTRVRTKSFLLSTIVIIVALGGSALLPMLLSGNPGTTVGVTGQATAIVGRLNDVASAQGMRLEVRDVADRAAGEREVLDGTLDALVAGAPDALTLIVKQNNQPELRGALDVVVQRTAMDAELAKNGLNPVDVRAAVQDAKVLVTNLEPSDPVTGQALVLALTAALLLYFFLVIGGQTVAQGVVEEKASRVVEILLATIRPGELLAGKVFGIGLTVLVQFAVVGAVAAGAALVSGALTLSSAAIAGMLALAIVWFVLGFFFYATILAAAAALVSRTEELQNVITPVLMLQVLPFVIGMSVLPANPDHPLGAVLSLVPGFSPVLMPMRVALGSATAWQVGLALVFSVAATVGLLRLGGRIYANAILRTGARVRLMDALRNE